MHKGPLAAALTVALTAGPAPAAEPVTFERHVRPILKAYCLDCHPLCPPAAAVGPQRPSNDLPASVRGNPALATGQTVKQAVPDSV